jgi:hypothetical protein
LGVDRTNAEGTANDAIDPKRKSNLAPEPTAVCFHVLGDQNGISAPLSTTGHLAAHLIAEQPWAFYDPP